MQIAAGRVAWAAPCHGDCWWARRVGGAVPWGLLAGPLSGWRRVLGIADQGVVWVAPCNDHGVVWVAPCLRDCWSRRRLGRRVFRIADQGLVAVLVRVAAGVLASQNGSFLKAALVQNRHFWCLVRVRAVAGPNGSFFKGRACTESSFLAFGAGPGSGGSKRFIFKGRACTESSFLVFGAGPGSGGSKRFIF